MPISKKDIERALSIFDSLIPQVESSLDDVCYESSTDESKQEQLLHTLCTLQSTVDVMKSPLFSSLVEIKQDYNQTIERSCKQSHDASGCSSKETKLKLESDPTLLPQFKQRYGVLNAEIHTNESAFAEIAAESIENDSDVTHNAHTKTFACPKTSSFPSTLVGQQLFEEAQGLAEEQQCTSSSSKSRPSSSKSRHSSHKLSERLRKMSAKKIFNRKTSTSSTGSVFLADLASTVPSSNSRELSDVSAGALSNVVASSNSRELSDVSAGTLSNVVASSDSSLSSLASEGAKPLLKTIQQDTFTTDYKPKSSQNKRIPDNKDMETEIDGTDGGLYASPGPLSNSPANEACSEDKQDPVSGKVDKESDAGSAEANGPKDILYFMRHEPSQTKIQQSLKQKEPWCVTLEQTERGLGMDLVGVSSTGVFVSELYSGGMALSSGLIHKGDQILKLNQHDTANMASFEVEMLLKDVSLGSVVNLVFGHNPIGWIEYQKLCHW